MTEKKLANLGRAALFIMTMIWGVSFVIMKDALDSMTTFYILATRFLGAAVLLLLFNIKRLGQLDKGYILGGIAMGAAMVAAYAVQTYGLMYTTPGKNAFLTTTYCIFVPFLYWAVIKKKPDRYNVLSTVFCVAGVALISLDGDLRMGKGDALTILSGLLFAVHMIITSGMVGKRNPVLLTMVQFAAAGIISLVLALIFEQRPAQLSPSAIWGMLYLVVFSTAICLLLQVFGQKYTPPSQAAIIMSLEAAFGAISSVIFMDETITGRLLAGFALTFAAVLISETKLSFLRRKKAEKIAE